MITKYVNLYSLFFLIHIKTILLRVNCVTFKLQLASVISLNVMSATKYAAMKIKYLLSSSYFGQL